MSIYKKIAEVGKKFVKQHKLFKYGFNLSPMYRRSTGRIKQVSPDLLHIEVRLPISIKNKNYVNSIFGGSMFSSVDPIPMVQLMNLIGDEFVVWDKSAEIKFLRPAKETLYADFDYTVEELEKIKKDVAEKKEIELVKTTLLTNQDRTVTFCEVKKTIYVAEKQFYKSKRKSSRSSN